MARFRSVFCIISAAVFVIVFHTGCANPTVTNTSRNIVEQMLLSTAVERCAAKFNVEEYEGSKVFIDVTNLAPQVDQPFVKGHFELHLRKNGIILAADEKDAQYTMRLITGTLATDSDQFLFGTPALPIPIPETTISVVVPEIALFKRLVRNAMAKFSITVLDTKTRQPLRVYENQMAKTAFINYTIIFFPFTVRNLDMVKAEGNDLNLDFEP